VRGAAGNAVAAALNGRAAALDAVAVDAHLATAAPVNLAESDAAEYSIVAGTDGAGYGIVAESEDARYSVFTGSDTIAGHGPGAVGSAPDSRIPVSHDRERAAGPQQVPVGHSGQGGRHRRRRPAWTAPTGQANALS
jgi:hypothetical protein